MPDRTILVTGANGGIGLATCIELARGDFAVVGTVRDDAAAETVRKAAADAGVDVGTEHLDVTDEAACRRVIGGVAPWGLVNNAGYAEAGPVTDIGDDEARAQLETLVLGPARLSRLAATAMCEKGDGGRIVNVSSIAAEISSPLLGWYQGAKRALEGISDAFRLELAGDGIDVVLVQPGMVRTGIWDDARGRLEDDDGQPRTEHAWASLTKRLEPLMASPEAVARTIRQAFEAGRPRDRYPVGFDAQVLTRVARVVPTAVTDSLTRALLKLG